MQSKSPVICVPICERSISAIEQAIIKADPVADMVEIRLDCLDPLQVDESLRHLGRLLEDSPKPTILTYRPAEQGGKRELNIADRLRFWVFNRPETSGFLDIEVDFASNAFVFDYVVAPPWSQVICSYHDFAGMPPDLDSLYDRMDKTPAEILKIAVQADDAVDCVGLFRLLERARKQGRKIIPIAMGTAGIATRILGPSRGAFLTYGSMDGTATAPGQLTAHELRETYRIEKLNRDTEIFGVVGLPVTQSVSPSVHNAAFEATGANAVYIPFEVRDLGAFISRMVHPRTREIDWKMRGLSVTTPHKIKVMDQLDWIDPVAKEIGAVNTIRVDAEGVSGYNTDAIGFIRPLARKLGNLRGLRCAVIGASGAASSAVWALEQEGAQVTIFARNPETAGALAKRFRAANETLSGAQFDGFDVVVNATTLGMAGQLEADTPATSSQLRGARLAYDLVYNPIETKFLCEATVAGCETLGGLPMFIAQAAEQFRLWTGTAAPEHVMFEAAEQALIRQLER
jgi:3-dehydroquinate dehydratase/shikimate dehydrogenase